MDGNQSHGSNCAGYNLWRERDVTREELDKAAVGLDKVAEMMSTQPQLEERISEIRNLLDAAMEALNHGDVATSNAHYKTMKKSLGALVCGERAA